MFKRTLVFVRNVTKNGLLVSVAVVSPAAEKKDVSFAIPKEEEKEQTGWDRLRLMYTKDEFGNLSPEMSAVLQTSFLSLFVGFVYGGFKASKEAYLDFIERNQATIYENVFDAKRKLQNHVTVNFGRGAFHWGWRLAVFCGSFQLFLTTIATYRGQASVMDYVASGLIAGSLYKFQHGPRGMIVGGTVGSVLGLFAGSLSQFLLSYCDSSFDELIEWQNKLHNLRDEQFKEGLVKYHEDQVQETVPLLKHHEVLHQGDSTNVSDKKEVK